MRDWRAAAIAPTSTAIPAKMAMDAAAAMACAICVSNIVICDVTSPTSISDEDGNAGGIDFANMRSAGFDTVKVATILCGAASKLPGENTIT